MNKRCLTTTFTNSSFGCTIHRRGVRRTSANTVGKKIHCFKGYTYLGFRLVFPKQEQLFFFKERKKEFQQKVILAFHLLSY